MKKLAVLLSLLIVVFILFFCSKGIDITKFEKSKYNKIEENNDISVKVKETKITTDTDEITLLLTNNTEMKFNYDREPHLEVRYNNCWYVLPVYMIACYAERASLNSNETNQKLVISLKDYYEKLRKGKYRFANEFESDGNKVLVATEFEIN